MQEKRRQRRRELLFHLAVTDRLTQSPTGHAVDITAGGFMLITPQPYEINSEAFFHIAVPKLRDGRTSIDIEAVCCWCKRDVNPGLWSSGFEFVNMQPRNTGAILELMLSCIV